MRRASGVAISLSVLIVALLTACRAGSPSVVDGPIDSGVRGVVTAGPQCPVVIQGSPCPDRPWQGTVRITTIGDDAVGEVQTDDRGRFEAPLGPGSYWLVPVTGAGGLPTASPSKVMVPDGAWVAVTLLVDTGLR